MWLVLMCSVCEQFSDSWCVGPALPLYCALPIATKRWSTDHGENSSLHDFTAGVGEHRGMKDLFEVLAAGRRDYEMLPSLSVEVESWTEFLLQLALKIGFYYTPHCSLKYFFRCPEVYEYGSGLYYQQAKF